MVNYFAHPQAIVEGIVGKDTRIWAWAHVMAGAIVGADCNIGEHCFIEGGAVIGDRVVIKNGVCVWEGVTVQSDTLLGPGAIFTNDREPRANVRKGIDRTVIGRGASIGAGAVILPVMVGSYASVGAGALVTADVPDYALVYGSPARQHGWVCECGRKINTLRGVECACGRKVNKIRQAV